MECKYCKYLQDYKSGISLDMIAKKNCCSLHFVVKVLHYWMVEKPNEIAECKKLLKDMEK